MLISRRDIFKMAWKRAKAQAAGYRNLRAAFAAALRSVWALVKAAVAEEARAAKSRPSWHGVDMPRTRAYNHAVAAHALGERGPLCKPHCW